MADRVFVVRHGETEWSASGRHTGVTDVPLTERGERQAQALESKVGSRRFSLVLSSPLRRALQTCRLAGLGGAVETCEDLREWNYGDYEGLTTPQIREQRPGWWLWRDGCPGGETADQVGARADRVLERCAEVEGDAALFAHGHVLRVLTARWLEMDAAAGARFALVAAGVGELGHERETQVISRWNV